MFEDDTKLNDDEIAWLKEEAFEEEEEEEEEVNDKKEIVTDAAKNRKYIKQIAQNSSCEYVARRPTLCWFCDRTGVLNHMKSEVANKPRPCSWLEAQISIPDGATFSASDEEIPRIKIITCPLFINRAANLGGETVTIEKIPFSDDELNILMKDLRGAEKNKKKQQADEEFDEYVAQLKEKEKRKICKAIEALDKAMKEKGLIR